MTFAQPIDFAALMEPVALRLLGDPNARLSKLPRDVRFGTHGSMAVNFEAGTFYDHEAKIGGGVTHLIKHRIGLDHAGAVSWLRREGFINSGPSRPAPPPRPAPATHQPSGDGDDEAGAEPQLQQRSRPRFVCTYDYTDEAGALLFQAVRYAEPKTFKQRRPGPEHGSWIWDLDGVRRVLYRLPDVIAAVEGGMMCIACEGEKDSDALGKLGFTATTNPMGAGRWRPEYSEFLRGANVVIIGDNDQAGHDHVEIVAKSLVGIAGRVRVLDLAKVWPECPEKGDVSDWISAGGTADKLSALVAALPDWKALDDTWPMMDEAAYCGLAGDVVMTIKPHTEADPVAILIQFLVYFGNAIGREPYYQIEADKHHTSLYGVLVGRSAKARKGTSGGRARSVFTDPVWLGRMKGGLSSGEGLINEVRDERKEWNKKEGREEVVDPGVADKRLMVTEAEFASALAVMERHGNILSSVIRTAWDGGRLSTITQEFSAYGDRRAHLDYRPHHRGRIAGQPHPHRHGERPRESVLARMRPALSAFAVWRQPQ